MSKSTIQGYAFTREWATCAHLDLVELLVADFGLLLCAARRLDCRLCGCPLRLERLRAFWPICTSIQMPQRSCSRNPAITILVALAKLAHLAGRLRHLSGGQLGGRCPHPLARLLHRFSLHPWHRLLQTFIAEKCIKTPCVRNITVDMVFVSVQQKSSDYCSSVAIFDSMVACPNNVRRT